MVSHKNSFSHRGKRQLFYIQIFHLGFSSTACDQAPSDGGKKLASEESRFEFRDHTRLSRTNSTWSLFAGYFFHRIAGTHDSLDLLIKFAREIYFMFQTLYCINLKSILQSVSLIYLPFDRQPEN